MSNLTGYEQETIINYNQEEKTASVYTHNPVLIRKLDKLVESNSDIIKLASGDYVVPKKWIKVSPPKKMNLSDEQRAATAERFAQMRASK